MEGVCEYGTNKLPKISGIINRLKYVFPKQILINYGSLVWGTTIKQIEILDLINVKDSSP